jgi:transaldolase
MKIFADGADLASIIELSKNPLIEGFTTNPSLMAKAGVVKYGAFAKDILRYSDKPFSFEVVTDDLGEMVEQAQEISSWGKNVYVKIPITNTKGESTANAIEVISNCGIKVNVTAITTIKQVEDVLPALKNSPGAYISIFAGRIADTGVIPQLTIISVLELIKQPCIEVIWASPREVLNIYQAEAIGCHIITCTKDLITKYEKLKGKDLTEYSIETVQMFYSDALKSGIKL